jgi:hypothetical protein
MCTFKTANRSNGNLRLTGPYLEFIRENFSVVTGLNKDRHCQERRLVLEDGVPKLITNGWIVISGYYDFQSNDFAYCKVSISK